MRRLASLALVAGCSGGETIPVEEDAANATDARSIDAPPTSVPDCTAPHVDPAPGLPPVAGTYCLTWTRLDGMQDPFPRYFDRADVGLDLVRWTADGGEEYTAGAAVVDGCLDVDPFSTVDGYSGSDVISLCWFSPTQASATMGWCSGGLRDAHWRLRLDPCQ